MRQLPLLCLQIAQQLTLCFMVVLACLLCCYAVAGMGGGHAAAAASCIRGQQQHT
jgi:hypothetical protein